MKLSQKLILGFASVALLLVSVGGIQMAFIQQIEGEVTEIGSSNIGEVKGSIDIAYRIARINADISRYLLEGINGQVESQASLRTRITSDWDQLNTLILSLKESTEAGLALADDDEEESGEKTEMEEIVELQAMLQEYGQAMHQTFGVADTQGFRAANVFFLQHHGPIEKSIRTASKDLFDDSVEEIQSSVDEVGAKVHNTVMFTFLFALAAFSIAVLIGTLVSRPILRRINALKRATQAIRNGDLDVQVSTLGAKDEIAELAHAFNDMVDNLRRSTASIQELNDQVAKRLQAEAALQKAHDDLEARVRSRTRDLEYARIEAESANRTKSEFLANMSHELRTPLNHIIGFTELVVDEKLGSLNEMQSEYLTDALTSSRHLLALINDILDLSKVEAGKMELNLTTVNVRAFLTNCMVMFKEKAMKHHIDVVLESESAPHTILADEIKLKQITYNLLSNAFKFTPDGGRIHVRAWKPDETDRPNARGESLCQNDGGNHWAITVADSGIGIPEDDLERIFNPFEQVSSRENTSKEGTGLGLTLTRRMVELHGGAIQATSKGHGQGAVFTITLPDGGESLAA